MIEKLLGHIESQDKKKDGELQIYNLGKNINYLLKFGWMTKIVHELENAIYYPLKLKKRKNNSDC